MSRKQRNNLIQIRGLVATESPQLPYHNGEHGLDVGNVSRKYGLLMVPCCNDRYILETGALLHDKIVVIGATDNETRTADFCRCYLPRLGYNETEIEGVCRIIMATKMPQDPKTLLERIICDADLDNLGRRDFFEKGEALRLELGFEDTLDFYKCQLQFLQEHKYHTWLAQRFRNIGKERNISKVKKIIDTWPKYLELKNSENVK